MEFDLKNDAKKANCVKLALRLLTGVGEMIFRDARVFNLFTENYTHRRRELKNLQQKRKLCRQKMKVHG